MMVSLFSVFDPVVIMNVPFNWMSLIFIFLFFPVSLYMLSSSMNEFCGFIMNSVGGLFKEVSFPNFLGIVMVGMTFFFFIVFNNVLGLFPFVFTGTSHISITFSLGLVIWVSFFVMGWVMKFKVSSAHLVPEGAPYVLAPFMVIIETVSHFIRPVTLSVRLAANMMAGHLIIGLISSISLLSGVSMVSSILLQVLMLILEWAVMFIQAFVFSVLILLYAIEYY